MQKSQQFDARYIPNMLPNTGYNIRFVLPELSSVSISAYLQFCWFCLNCSNQRICIPNEDMTSIRRASYSTFATQSCIYESVCAMSPLVPVKSKEVTVPHIQASIFNWIYLCYYWWFDYNLMRIILHICLQILGTASGLRYLNSVQIQVQRICSFADSV